MRISAPRGALLADQAHGWGQLVHAASGVARVETAVAHWVLPTARALWVPPHERPTLHCLTVLSLATLYFAPQELPDLPQHCVVVSLPPLLRELVVEVGLRAPLRDGSDREGRLIAVLRDELAVAPREPTALPLPTDPVARRLAERMLAEPASPASLTELCEQSGASRRTVERRFRNETGTSLGQWCRQARLQHALIGLGEGRTVARVAAEVGYRSASAFVHAFRRTFGCTPRAMA